MIVRVDVILFVKNVLLRLEKSVPLMSSQQQIIFLTSGIIKKQKPISY